MIIWFLKRTFERVCCCRNQTVSCPFWTLSELREILDRSVLGQNWQFRSILGLAWFAFQSLIDSTPHHFLWHELTSLYLVGSRIYLCYFLVCMRSDVLLNFQNIETVKWIQVQSECFISLQLWCICDLCRRDCISIHLIGFIGWSIDHAPPNVTCEAIKMKYQWNRTFYLLSVHFIK